MEIQSKMISFCSMVNSFAFKRDRQLSDVSSNAYPILKKQAQQHFAFPIEKIVAFK